MKLQISELEGGIRLISLDGKLDSNGVYAVEVDFGRHCGGEKRRILVDLSRVSYISSIGIPLLVNTAKSVMSHGGKFALLSPQQEVMNVFEMVGVSRIIPIYYDIRTAKSSI
ncbi:MAG: STAS domain-containing protein [Anaerolineales bacterium]|nr:STAS domain-containing protein [Anaerolineales bacterium]